MGPSLLATGPAQAAGVVVTAEEPAALTARAGRIDRIIHALQAFEDCETDAEHMSAEKGLKDALAGEPKIPVDAP